ncbi:PDC sensor domain-containing protein [Lederbergia citrea]|nr:PDC sensor domain-containing protein [Lederbergia citrea]MBS4204344.1 PDC sensor domain-containing protein [Lederbergia citrea]
MSLKNCFYRLLWNYKIIDRVSGQYGISAMKAVRKDGKLIGVVGIDDRKL